MGEGSIKSAVAGEPAGTSSRKTRLFIGWRTFALIVLWPLVSPAQQAVAPKPPGSEEGVYTSAQAQRGERNYIASCSVCHLAQLTGNERVPSLAGDAFLRRWQPFTLQDLFARVKGTMPQSAPGSLSDQSYVDIIAYILQANGYTTGDRTLIADPVTLKAAAFGGLR
jgi:cytochrome c553